MSRTDWIAPGGNSRKERIRSSILYRGSLDTPAISPAELDEWNAAVTWVTRLNEKTMREKSLPKKVVESWTVSLSKSLVPQMDAEGNHRDFGSLEEWVQTIKDILPKNIQVKLFPTPGIRQ